MSVQAGMIKTTLIVQFVLQLALLPGAVSWTCGPKSDCMYTGCGGPEWRCYAGGSYNYVPGTGGSPRCVFVNYYDPSSPTRWRLDDCPNPQALSVLLVRGQSRGLACCAFRALTLQLVLQSALHAPAAPILKVNIGVGRGP
eukprot:CAMPEP_0173387454 /NCGR_PEP_ID=MMETSP1356-20130122/9958_1 /TAXON_ID=77927 ORGANISM="Hemiselmis virescens, Strain PCC157" /NCGR_SAMPLE_ID=MMETSP1356 /ASSEMBLY_ACC=CAM_ASM_000847 /LENGTH=140 /DNA_ID=CAMNT_0014344081 /DNA_START=276 /DNA_END=696 /DNA_ORIENTATION=-